MLQPNTINKRSWYNFHYFNISVVDEQHIDMCQVRLIRVYDDDDDEDDNFSYKQLKFTIFPFLIVIKPSQVSPYSSSSLAAQDPTTHISTIPNVDHLPATSSPFRKHTVSSPLQPSAFPPSSSVQITAVSDNRRLTLSKNVSGFWVFLRRESNRYLMRPLCLSNR